MVWTASGPIKILSEFCPKVLVGHQVGYMNFLVFHDNGHSAIFDSTFMKEHNLIGSAQIKSERVEDYCESSEATEIVERFQRVEKLGLMITVLLRGSVGIYEPCLAMLKKDDSSDPENGIKDLDTSSCERWLKIIEGNGITGGMICKCTIIKPEASASPATPNSMTS